MNVPLLLGYIALAMVVLGASTPVNGFDHQIYVSCSSSETIGNDTCRPSHDGLHCTTLDQALKELQYNSTVVYIKSGICSLSKEVHFQYKTDIAIIGDNDGGTNVVIECSDYTGLSFSYSSNIILESLTLRQCGAFQNSTSRNIRKDIVFKYFCFTSALYMLFCANVTLIDVHLHHSNGVGLVLYNTVGNVTIKGCVFFNQSDAFPNQTTVVGGGGLQIEFSYCIPGNLNCLKSGHSQVDSQYSSGAFYVITDSIFKLNQAHRGSEFVFKLSNEESSYFAFGKGGGLSIILKGNAHGNNFLINNCTFYKNYAHYGGGFYVAFHDQSRANRVSITNCNITANENFDIHYNVLDFDSGGGGGMIVFLSGTNDTNVFQIHDSTFHDNVGLSGGGLAVEAIANFEKLNGSLSLDNLVFQNNSAFLGSAIYFFQDNSNCQFKLVVNISNSSFINNSPICSKKKARSFASLVCSGIVYSNAQDLQLTGELLFTNNTASALEIRYSRVNVLDGAKLVFQNNTSIYGGGLALYECSFIEVYPQTQFIFDNNSATKYGGAIYSGPCAQSAQSSILSMKCFISYFNRSTIPDDWDTEFNFTNNVIRTDSSTNSVYASSITSCLWPDGYDTFKIDYNRTFCWNPFHYYPDNCTDSIDSGPAFLSYSNKGFVIFPGQTINSPDVYNGFKRKIKDPPIQACIKFGSASLDNSQMKKCMRFPSTGVLYVYQYGSGDFVTSDIIYLTTTTITPEHLQSTFKITFKNCSWPFQFDTKQCSFLLPYFCCSDGCGEQCGIGSVIHPNERYCIYCNNDLDLIVGRCPFAYSNKPKFVFSYSNKSFSELQVCANNRTGPLCGQCEKDLGIPINSVYFECKDCHGNIILKSWFIFILLELLPLTVMVVIILVFNIRLTDGFFAGLVLYAQIISVDFQGWYYPAWLTVQQDTSFKGDYLTYISTSPYSILNLNFLRMLGPSWSNPVCLTSDMGPLAVFTTWYCIAFYPFFLLLLLLILQTLYDNGSLCVFIVFKCIRKMLARFQQFLNIQASLMEFAASIYVLSFTQFVSLSYKMLHYSTWQSMTNENLKGRVFFYDASLNYFGWPHAFFGIFAFTILFFIILLPTLFLSLYQFKWFHQFLTLCKLRYQFLVSFGDVFSGSLKNGTGNSKLDFRSFAGFYLVFRIIAMQFYYITSDPKIVLYCETCLSLLFAGFIMIFRPYKKKIVNFAEFTVFSVLGLMSAICLSQRQGGRHICVVAIMHIPIVLLLVYIVYRIVTKVYQHFKNCCPLQDGNDNCSNEEFQDSMTMDTFPDRVLNPTEYQERHVGFVSSESTPSSLNSSQIHLQNPASGHSSNDSQTNDTRFETSSRTTVQIGNTAKTNTTSRTTFQTSIRSSVRNTTSDYGSARTDDS